MSPLDNAQWIRKVNLVLRQNEKGLDLSDCHFRFETQQQSEQSPNTCAIRVWNLSEETVTKVRKEFDSVVLQAGYQTAQFGTVFAGSIKQFRVGRESNKDSYLDILSADGDVGYNFGVVSATISRNQTLADAIDAAAGAMGMPVADVVPDFNGPEAKTMIRGKVLWGMARDVLRDAARSVDAAWSIQNGQVVLIPLTGYAAGEAVVLNAGTGLVGIPELTDGGLRCRCLMNPKVRVGGLVKINNKDVNKTVQQSPDDLRQFNSWRDINHTAKENADGLYMVLVAEHAGDTRATDWYSNLTCIAVDSSSGTVKAYG